MGHTLVMDGKGIFEEQKRGRHQQVLAALCLGVLIYLGLRNRHLQEQLLCKRGW